MVEEKRLERERQEWATGMANAPVQEEAPYQALEILPSHNQLMEAVTKLGRYYSVVERCLLLASMQRAFTCQPTFAELENGRALKTSLVDTCLFAARRSAQRGFGTGHCGTASAMINFSGDTLGGVLLEVMTRRAQDSGVAKLKPGDGLLEGSLSLFSTTSNLMRGTTQNQSDDEATRQQKMQQAPVRL